MSEPNSNIRTLFTFAKKLTQDLDSLASSTQEYQDNLRRAISTFEECRKLVDSINLWSPNEIEDDISSGDLTYLSIDYYLGNLISNGIKSDRKDQILNAREAYGRFLTLLDQYAILSTSDQKLWERYQDDKDEFTLLASSDASERRASKIARFKEGKELEQKIEVRGTAVCEEQSNSRYSTIKSSLRTACKTTRPSAPYIIPKSAFKPTAPSKLLILSLKKSRSSP